MENWCYDEATVYGDQKLAVHFETGEELPRHLFAKLKEQQQYQAGMVMLRQLYFGTLDMTLHGPPALMGNDGDKLASPFEVSVLKRESVREREI